MMKRANLRTLCGVSDSRRIRNEESYTVERPLRIDFAGGWSDTPPICHELGGCVFNAAVTLNGVKPVKATVGRIDVAEVRVESVDLRKSAVYRTDAEIADHSDPHDWGALVKSALTVVGYRLAMGGLDIRISADVPKGSGMGTSSILGATLIEALGKALERNYNWRKIAELTLSLEREMCTGGGWEDQIGGLLPGAKLVVTRKGQAQRFRVRELSAAEKSTFAKFLRQRALLYFTGQKRMARNVLRGVLGFYRENPYGIATAIIDRLKRDAAESFEAVKRGDWQLFCAAVNGYWMSKKALDPGSTNPQVESIIARIAPWTSAVSLCGAGGGGFMFIVARNSADRKLVKKILEEHPPIAAGRFFEMELA